MNNLFLNVIKKRRFHDIPDWMIQHVNITMLVELYPKMMDIIDEHIDCSVTPYSYYEKNTGLADLYSFLSRVRDKNHIDAKRFLSAIEKSSHCIYTSSVCVIMWMVRSDRECAKIARSLFYNKDISLSPHYLKQCCAIYKYQFGSMPVRLIDAFLGYVNSCMVCDEGDHIIRVLFSALGCDTEYQPALEHAFHMVTGGDFLDEFIDVLRLRAAKYYWGDRVFALENIWAHGMSYLPKHMDMQYFIAYLWIMSNSPKIELSGRALLYINQALQGDDIYLRDMVFKSVKLLFVGDDDALNANNIRFLTPFYDIPEYGWDVDIIIQHLLEGDFFMPNGEVGFHTSPHQVLRDFTYFLPKDMNNDTIQRRFLMQRGGNPNTLLSREFGGDTYIRTAEGICRAIIYSNPFYLEELLMDSDICSILVNEVMGKVGFSPIIEKLVPVVERGVVEDKGMNFHTIQMMINKHYPMVETGGDVCVPLLRISPVSNVESSSIILRWTKAAFHISIYDQSAKDLMSSIKANCARGEYIPLYYGMTKEHGGIEEILKPTEIIQILKDNNAYYADIKNPDVAELLFSHRFIWEN